MTSRSVFSERTLVPISLVIGLVGGFGAVVAFGVAAQHDIATMQKDVAEVQRHRDEFERETRAQLQSLISQVSVVDTRLTILTEYVKKGRKP